MVHLACEQIVAASNPMIKILHTADLHLGVENYGRIDPETGLSTRLGDFLAVFDQVVEYVLENKIDLFLFCGDVYKSRDPSQTHQREFARRVGRLASNGIPVFLLVGNHDLPNAIGRATTVEIFDTLSVKNVIVANHPGTYRIDTRDGGLQIVALPWVRRSAILSREETRNLTLEETNRRLEEILVDELMSEVSSLDPTIPAILAAHVSVSGARIGSERTMMVGREHLLPQSAIANPAFDYVALGHIHKTQVLFSSPPVVYSGSLERVDFNEEEDEKGFYSVEIEGRGRVSFEFHPVRARPFLTIEADISAQDPDPTATVLRAISRREQEIKDSVVRVRVTIPEAQEGLLREGEIRRALSQAHFIAAIAKEVEREPRARLGSQQVEELTTLDALKLYLDSKKTPQDRARVLLEYGEGIIKDGGS